LTQHLSGENNCTPSNGSQRGTSDMMNRESTSIKRRKRPTN
jgi:hypothetical protein